MIRLALATAVLALAAGPVAAHGGLPGGAGFLSGLLHPLVAIEHLILLIGVGLLAGQCPPSGRPAGFAAVGVGLLGGLGAVMAGVSWTWAGGAIVGLAVVAGGLAALAARRQPKWLLPLLAGMAGLLVGLDTDATTTATAGFAGPVAQVAGVLTGVYLIVLDAAALAAFAIRSAASVAPRVAGSWIVAVALLLLSLSLSSVAR